MNLLVDIGNSRIKWAWQTPGVRGLHTPGFGSYKQTAPMAFFDCHWIDFDVPERVLVANVAGPDVEESLGKWLAHKWQIKVEFIRVERETCGMVNGYEDWSRLGVDRWLAVIAGWKKYRQAACIVDCGTATTIDGISETGYHLGGVIMPGPSMMQTMLRQRLSNLVFPHQPQPALDFFAKNTEQGISNGCYLAVAAMIEKIVKARQSNHALRCVITGGHAEQLLNFLTIEFDYETDLVLQGLACITGK